MQMIRKNPENHWRNQFVKRKNTDEKKTQDANSEFQEHSQNSWTEPAVKTFEIKFEEKPKEKRNLLSGSEF